MQSGWVAARRSAVALVGQLGGDEALLELPLPPVAGDDGEQLGLRTPEFQQRVLSPVAVRRGKSAPVLLVAAAVLEDVLGVRDAGAVGSVMTSVQAVVVGNARYRLLRVEAVHAMGSACVYRMLLDAAETGVV